MFLTVFHPSGTLKDCTICDYSQAVPCLQLHLDEDKQDDPGVSDDKGENKKLFERYALLLLY